MSTSKHHKSPTYVSKYLPDKSTSTPRYPSNLTQANLNAPSSSPAQLAEFNPPVFPGLKTLKAFQLLLPYHTLLFTESVDLTSIMCLKSGLSSWSSCRPLSLLSWTFAVTSPFKPSLKMPSVPFSMASDLK